MVLRLACLLCIGAAFAALPSDGEGMANLEAIDVKEELLVPKTAVKEAGIPKAQISLAEIQASTLDTLHGTEAMSAEMSQEAAHRFIQLAASFKNEHLQKDSMETVRMAQEVMLGEGTKSKMTGNGLDVIFRKLNQLRDEILNDMKVGLASITLKRAECKKLITDTNNLIKGSSDQQYENYKAVETAKTRTLPETRALRAESRKLEDRTQATLLDERKDRKAMAATVRAEVDEKNKAIDVLVKAAFLVCERFPRYKNTKECRIIISEPDVDEPIRYDTLPYDAAKKATIEAHAAKLPSGDDNIWYTRWKSRATADQKKIGAKDPEGLLKPVAEEEKKVESLESSVELIDMGEEAHENHGATALSEAEESATRELEILSKGADLRSQYAVPLSELALSIRNGDTKRSKSIVTIIMEVLNETREEVSKAKAIFQVKMDDYYKTSMAYKGIMLNCETDQKNHMTILERNRIMIIEKMASTEKERLSSNLALKSRKQTEHACWKDEETYSLAEAINKEDLENLYKLKSLLRSLYNKKHPKACPKFGGKMCSSQEAGWCIYTKDKASEGNDQRCSCNVGFYGPACQYKQCPGTAFALYNKGAPGACSDRGECDHTNGLCVCRKEFYHGPKNACDFKHAPPSKGGVIDNKAGVR
jgi:hypothetical protein